MTVDDDQLLLLLLLIRQLQQPPLRRPVNEHTGDPVAVPIEGVEALHLAHDVAQLRLIGLDKTPSQRSGKLRQQQLS